MRAAQLLQDEQRRWESEYRDEDYGRVWSMTQDPEVRLAISKYIERGDRDVLIPGCGARIELPLDLAQHFPDMAITCTDYSEFAIRMAQKRWYDEARNDGLPTDQVSFEVRDTTRLAFGTRRRFDVVIVVNSILSGVHRVNLRMMRECFRVLRPGGRLVGFFPTVFSGMDIASMDPRFAQWRDGEGVLDLASNTFRERDQGLQTFYTPLRLTRLIAEAGFKRRRFEIHLCDSAYFQRESERIYGLPAGCGLYVWEQLVVAARSESNSR